MDVRGKKTSLKSLPGRRRSPRLLATVYELNKHMNKKVYTSSYEDLFDSLGQKPVKKLLKWFLSPTKPEIFFKEHWEKQPFQVRHSSRNHYNGLYSLKEFSQNVQQNDFHYNEEIEVMAYNDGEQKIFHYDAKVVPSYLWATFKDGYSIKLQNAQVYSKSLGSLCSILQEYFSNHVEANTYLTPANAQDFPPRCNDSNAFILQIEGKNLWKLYIPSASQILTNSSDDSFEAESTEPCMEVELNPGDLLYIPSGHIYQAQAASGMYSLHIIISFSQLNTWGNFLKHALNIAIDEATENDGEFRKSIPKDYLDYMGQIYSDSDSKERRNFRMKATRLIEKTFNNVSLDFAADAQGLSFVHGSMPPILTPLEKECSVHWNGARFENGTVLVTRELTIETKIQFLRRRAFKLVVDSDGTHICHSLYNQKGEKEETLNLIEVDPKYLPDVAALFKVCNFIKIKDLPNGESVQLLDFLQRLYDNGALMTDRPLPLED